MEKAKTQTKRESFLRSRRKEPAAKGETRSESFLRNSGENEASQQKDERQLAESRLIGTQDNILGVLTQPRRLDHNSLAGHHHQSKFALLASAAAVLSSTGQQQQQQLPHSPMMTAGQRMAAALPDGILTDKKIKSSTIPAVMLAGAAADLYSQDSLSTLSKHLNPRMSGIVHGAFKKDKGERKREARQMRQMSRHEISVDDPFMTNNVDVGAQLLNNNLMQEMENWEHPWWH